MTTPSGTTPEPRKPRIGVSLPTAGAGATPDAITTMAAGGGTARTRLGLGVRAAAEAGLRRARQHVRLPDHYASVLDPLEALTWAAAHTSRIQVGTSVLDTLFHPPVLLAKRIATLDLLSGGRAVFGLGQGWMPEEFAAAGVPMSRRGAGFEDHLAAMRACWGPDPVEYDGPTYTIARAEAGPKPAGGRVPLLIGAGAQAAVERAVRIGDGFNPVHMDWDTTTAQVGWYRDAGGAGPVVLLLNVMDVDTIDDDLDRAAALGINEVIVNFAMTDLDVAAQVAVLKRLVAAPA